MLHVEIEAGVVVVIDSASWQQGHVEDRRHVQDVVTLATPEQLGRNLVVADQNSYDAAVTGSPGDDREAVGVRAHDLEARRRALQLSESDERLTGLVRCGPVGSKQIV